MTDEENHVSLKKYLEVKFSALERHIDQKFDTQEDINANIEKRLCYLEQKKCSSLDEKINSLARRESYIDGALVVIIAIVGYILSSLS
ncbi:hypothetical protein [Methanococcoides sp. AM1]|uniref:hypothetical protein n=1 Tax=Methanococcoides sp. AM1 TaxID=1201011 RepID=UPI0010828884|nr:hypothetical protein [Methanococcoides sp. AM1]